MKVIAWNMGGGYGYRHDRHDAAWRYLELQDPDVALLQEAVPPSWAYRCWAGVVAAPKYPGGRIPWGSVVVTKTGPLDAVLPTARTYWLNELWGGTVTACARGLGGILLTSIHSKAESRRPSEFAAKRMATVARCHSGKVWEIERALADLAPLLAGRPFIAGGDLNSSLLFDSIYRRRTNAKLFANIADAGLHDLRAPFHEDEQQTYFKRGRRPYQLDHVFADQSTVARAKGWSVLREAATELELSDHAPIEIVIADGVGATSRSAEPTTASTDPRSITTRRSK